MRVSIGKEGVETLSLLLGASSDFEQATNIAENMVLRFGMSDKVRYYLKMGFSARTFL